LRGFSGHLAEPPARKHSRLVEDETTYREELRAILFLLADIKVAMLEILSYIRDDDEEEEEEDDLPDA
jgi:hypothetical protein